MRIKSFLSQCQLLILMFVIGCILELEDRTFKCDLGGSFEWRDIVSILLYNCGRNVDVILQKLLCILDGWVNRGKTFGHCVEKNRGSFCLGKRIKSYSRKKKTQR